jgi:hypothetical protein
MITESRSGKKGVERKSLERSTWALLKKGLRGAKTTGFWRLSGGEIARDHLFSVQPTWNV